MSDQGELMSLEAETDFTLSLLRQQNLTESLVFSPLSIALALSLIHVGAKGNTQKQLGNALLKGKTPEEVEKHYAALSQSLLDNPNPEVQAYVANRLFARNGYTVNQAYLDEIQKSFAAKAINLDFSKADESAGVINNFVKESTHGKIEEIVSANSIDDNTIAFLVNALYFKGKWFDKFDHISTFKLDFYSAENQKREIDFLGAQDTREYSENNNWQVLSLPYEHNAYTFNVFLPKKRFGLQDGIKNLKSAEIHSLLSAKKAKIVDTRLPRFKLSSDIKLVDTLNALGITDAFGSNADFSGIGPGLSVSDVLHRAVIEVDEEGTTAAAATSVQMVLERMLITKEDPIEFKADHPFLFVLARDNHPLFVGVHN